MKLLTAFAVAALSLTFGASAFAQTSTSGLTRAEVVAQLQQAQAEGLLPTTDGDYPPTAAEVARNREIYAIQHGTHEAGAVRTAGTAGTAPAL
ncbi:DUF4148 domain-containing protein [Paraburkholderia aromaticivorans]|uniref:DUF4148 domain-containing protein n=1 Tax=Paraburkholderia aromaticivorans TaxID=2026199 RepID=A0A248VPZ4_9BURK|nr:DUF4148 domain-containing protein [Paraburkholderia aromaticivorans]ASW00945.1 hypothetical protein CJU94_22225 [Paraburkholderia aromaticivorans]